MYCQGHKTKVPSQSRKESRRRGQIYLFDSLKKFDIWFIISVQFLDFHKTVVHCDVFKVLLARKFAFLSPHFSFYVKFQKKKKTVNCWSFQLL